MSEFTLRLRAVLAAMPTRHRLARLALLGLVAGVAVFMVVTGTVTALLVIALMIGLFGVAGALWELALLAGDTSRFDQDGEGRC